MGQHLAADAALLRLTVGQEALRRREDSDAHPAQHAWDLVAAGVDPAAGRGDPPDPRDGPLAVGAELELEHDLAVLAVAVDLDVADVALPLEDASDLLLHVRGRDHDLVLERRVGVPDPGQHVGDGIGHDHERITSPRRLGHAGDLALVRQLPEADAAQHEFAEYSSWTPAPLAPRVGPHGELPAGPTLLLDQCLLRHDVSSMLSLRPR